jgi:polyisoprenoid-binding protein YceI
MNRSAIALSALALWLAGCAQNSAPSTEEDPAPATAVVEATAAVPAASEGASDPVVPAPGGTRGFVIVPGESKVSYEVGETFFREGNRFSTAIGTTTEINGEIQVDMQNPANSTIGPIEVDISAFTSDRDRRDQAIRERWLQSASYPIATFKPTAIEGVPPTYAEGQDVSIRVTGDLTVRDTTRPVTFDVTGKIVGDQMSGTATTAIKMSDFNFQAPEIAGMLKAEDDVKLIFAFVARAEE